jgi:hypothetical protein
MMNIKKRLMIEVEDQKEDDEETQILQINKECDNLQFPESPLSYEGLMLNEEARNKILEMNNPFLNQILFYMEGENPISDFSGFW